MLNVDGSEMSEKEILKCGLEHLADACAFLYEIEDDAVIALAYMVDSLLKCSNAILNDADPCLIGS